MGALLGAKGIIYAVIIAVVMGIGWTAATKWHDIDGLKNEIETKTKEIETIKLRVEELKTAMTKLRIDKDNNNNDKSRRISKVAPSNGGNIISNSDISGLREYFNNTK